MFKKILKFSIGAAAALLFFELYFQTSEIFNPSFVMDDAFFGRKLKPNARITAIKESYNMTEVNEAGYLGKAYPIKKSTPNTVRIALIGDSFVEGFQVKDKFHFRNVLESELAKNNPGMNFEVLNFGRSGLDFRTMYIFYELIVKHYNPDIVLIFVNESDFKTRDENLGPYLMLNNSNGTFSFDYSFNNSESFRKKIKTSYLRRFSMYSLLQADLAAFESGKTMQVLFDKLYPLSEKSEEVTKSNFDSDPFKPLNRAILNEYSKVQSNTGTQFYTVSVNKLTDDTRKLIDSSGIKVFDLEEVYRRLTFNNINPFYWKATNMMGHWNQDAHYAIGKYISYKITGILENK